MNLKPLSSNQNLNLTLRLVACMIWAGTVFRRIFIPNFEARISKMAGGSTLFPKSIMDWAVSNWQLIFFAVLFIEIVISISLLFGIFARFGSLLATVNGIGIGMAGLGLGIADLLIPWSVAVVTLYLFLFTHPGLYKGLDKNLQSNEKLPNSLKKLI